MVPRPEDQKNYPERRAAQEAGEIYSTSSDEECAKLVKSGQLDTFSKPRKITHQHTKDFLGHKPLKESTRGRTDQRPIFTERRNARSSSRDTIRVGDRVIVKEKYIGLCRYVGPIEEKYILPEIFIGVELDEPLTDNSGVFGSRQYFDCEHGFGLMVSSTKVRKIRDVAFSDTVRTRTTGMKNAKSFSNLSREQSSSRSTKHRVSQGYRTSDDYGRSKTLIHQNLHAVDHPMSTLHNIKQYQEYATFPNKAASHRSVPVRRDPYGVPLQFHTSSQTFPFPDGDLLRESFRRIVAPMPPSGAFHSYQHGYDHPLYRNASMPHMYYPPSAGSNLMPLENDLFRTRSMPNSAKFLNNAQRRVSTASSYSSGIGSLEQQLSVDNSMQQSPYYYKYQQPICSKCSSCRVCSPIQISQLSGNTVPNFSPHGIRKTKSSHDSPLQKSQLSGNRVPSFSPHIIRTTISSHDSPVSSDQSGYKSSQSFPRNPSLLKSSDRVLKTLSANSVESIEYEKWKANYGNSVGRGMKKGLNKLTSALLYS